MPSLKKRQTFIEFLPHLALILGIVLVSLYIGYMMALNPSSINQSKTTQADPYLINNPVNDIDPIDTNNPSSNIDPTNIIDSTNYIDPANKSEIKLDLPSDITQTNQQPFDMTLEISDAGFSPLTAQLTNQQLLRVINTASTPQVISLNNDTLMIYPSSEYVFALDSLSSGQHIIWADSEEGMTQQASITII